jgi:Cro/C1-type helix-turn-helix DNA-binding protein
MKKIPALFYQLLSLYPSDRAFAHAINEDTSDVHRWRHEKKKLTTRAIISICRLFDCRPHDLDPDLFPEDLYFVFKSKGEK